MVGLADKELIITEVVGATYDGSVVSILARAVEKDDEQEKIVELVFSDIEATLREIEYMLDVVKALKKKERG